VRVRVRVWVRVRVRVWVRVRVGVRAEGDGQAAHREERDHHEQRALAQLTRPAMVGHAVQRDLRR